MKITLCVSVPNGGQQMLALLALSAARTMSGRHEVDLRYTCHGEEQKKLVTDEGIALPVAGAHIVEREPNTYPHSNSVTHSRCINALFDHTDSDIAVICDYDGAFVYRGWDEALVDALDTRGQAFFGAPYSSRLAWPLQLGAAKVLGRKYQGKPNCIFLAYMPARIKALTPKLCEFAELYGTPDSVPVKFISNHRESAEFGLPVGSFVHLDTGSSVPRLIAEHHLPAEIMTRVTGNYSVLQVRTPPESETAMEGTLFPEEYLHRGSPFFVHYRKGTRKSEESSYQLGYGQESFARDIRAYLAKIA